MLPPRQGRVWLVEDSRLEAELAVSRLSQTYEVEHFSDGAAVLERLACSDSDANLPDLIVLDWQLPGVSGLEVCRFVRTRYDPLMLPVLMLTVRGARADFVEGLGAGANDYVAKPYDEAEFLARVRTLVQVRQLHARMQQVEAQLIGIVSHDLRNPIAAISGTAAMLLRHHDLDERATKSVARIASSAARANHLILDLLDFTRAKLGDGIPLSKGPTRLDAVVAQALEELEVAWPDRIQYEDICECEGEWDARRLGQVVSNLVTNALQYSPESARVSIRVRDEETWAVLEVHNSGPAISREMLPRIFQSLQRGASGGDGHRRNVGLGLFIVEQIVRAHQGRVTVDSSEEEGTFFRVHLPKVRSAVLETSPLLS